MCVRRPPGLVAVDGFEPLALPFCADPPEAPAVDLTLLTVKAQDTASTRPWLDRLCREGRPVAVIQNGVHHARRVAPYAAIPVLAYVYVEAQGDIRRGFAPPRAHCT